LGSSTMTRCTRMTAGMSDMWSGTRTLGLFSRSRLANTWVRFVMGSASSPSSHDLTATVGHGGSAASVLPAPVARRVPCVRCALGAGTSPGLKHCPKPSAKAPTIDGRNRLGVKRHSEIRLADAARIDTRSEAAPDGAGLLHGDVVDGRLRLCRTRSPRLG
jgi:hypothetical protein